MGMDEETRRRCLEPFFSTKGQRGTGLGLAMVYGIMERHEGNIEIESQTGKGTIMRLIFPVRDAIQLDDDTTILSRSQLAPPLRLLCIYDETMLRQILKEILESDWHTVDVADGVQAGIESFRAKRDKGEASDVAITDFGMPY